MRRSCRLVKRVGRPSYSSPLGSQPPRQREFANRDRDHLSGDRGQSGDASYLCLSARDTGIAAPFQCPLHIDIADAHHLLGAVERADAQLGCIDCIAAIERIGAGLVDDGLQPSFTKAAAAAIEPDAVDVEDIEEVVEAQANGAGPFVHQGADHGISLMVECEQLGRIQLHPRQRRVVGTGLLLEKHPGPFFDGKQRGDRLQAAVAAAGTGAAVRVDDGVAYLAAAKQGAPIDLAVDDKG